MKYNFVIILLYFWLQNEQPNIGISQFSLLLFSHLGTENLKNHFLNLKIQIFDKILTTLKKAN